MKRRLFSLIIICLLIFAVSCSKRKPSLDSKDCHKARGYYQLGVSYMNANDPTGALEELLKAEKLCEHSPDLQNALGLVYYAKERFPKAIAHFERALEEDPNDSDARHNLGVVYLYLNRYDEAIVAFKKALENDLYRNQANSLNALGWAYYKKSDFAEAEKWFKQTLEHDRLYLPAYDNLAKVYIALQRFEDATVELTKALDINEYFVEAWLDLGICHLKLGNVEKAKASFQKVMEIDPFGKLGSQAQEFMKLLE